VPVQGAQPVQSLEQLLQVSPLPPSQQPSPQDTPRLQLV
jgi:hypothetical protein